MSEYASGCMMNPYLASLVKKTREQVPDDVLRDEYATETRKAAAKGRSLSWEEFLGERALRDAMDENPTLLTRRADFPLPQETLDGLYWLHVDVLADLLQITEGELERFEKVERLSLKKIRRYLSSVDLRLCSSDAENTWKLPALRIAEPGKAGGWKTWDFTYYAGHRLKLDRPSLVQDWFEEYYKRYEYQRGEEKLREEWAKVKPVLEYGTFPSDMEEFFRDTRYFFTEYKMVCDREGIPELVDMPTLPDIPEELEYFSNDRYPSIMKAVTRAVISVLERSDLLGRPPQEFLQADDIEKLDIIGEIKWDDTFQLMLIEYVGLRVDLDNVIEYFKLLVDGTAVAGERADETGKKIQDGRPVPINPWLAEVIRRYRKETPDSTIREAYRLFCELSPVKSWEDYVAEQALMFEGRRDPFILTRLDECDELLEVTTDFLASNCAAEIVADLLQITEEELVELFEGRLWELPRIEDLLKKHHLHLYHSDRRTYKLSFPQY